MSIKKQALKTKPFCKVTFELTKEETENAQTVCVVGDFNNWNAEMGVMEELKTKFKLTLELETDKEYQFKYLLDNKRWLNETEADQHISSPYGDSENSLIVL